MNNNVVIQNISLNDSKAILNFLQNLYKENLDTLFKHLSLPTIEEQENFIEKIYLTGGIIFGAKIENNIVGLLTAARYKNFQLNHSILIGISVLKNFRNRGIGSNLLLKLENWAKTNAVLRIELEVFSNNTRAIKFYKKAGYIIEGIKKDAVKIDDKFYDIILMTKYIEKDEK